MIIKAFTSLTEEERDALISLHCSPNPPDAGSHYFEARFAVEANQRGVVMWLIVSDYAANVLRRLAILSHDYHSSAQIRRTITEGDTIHVIARLTNKRRIGVQVTAFAAQTMSEFAPRLLVSAWCKPKCERGPLGWPFIRQNGTTSGSDPDRRLMVVQWMPLSRLDEADFSQRYDDVGTLGSFCRRLSDHVELNNS